MTIKYYISAHIADYILTYFYTHLFNIWVPLHFRGHIVPFTLDLSKKYCFIHTGLQYIYTVLFIVNGDNSGNSDNKYIM